MSEIRFVDPEFAKTAKMRDTFPFVRSKCVFDDAEAAITLCPAIRYLKNNPVNLCYGTMVNHNDTVLKQNVDVIVERKKTEPEIRRLCATCVFKDQQVRE